MFMDDDPPPADIWSSSEDDDDDGIGSDGGSGTVGGGGGLNSSVQLREVIGRRNQSIRWNDNIYSSNSLRLGGGGGSGAVVPDLATSHGSAGPFQSKLPSSGLSNNP